jgi:CPA1 family monovalent cation:H+ antiporter
MAIGSSVVVLFVVAAIVALVTRRIRVPYTVALVVVGLGLGAANVVTPIVLTKDLLFTVFLPGILFEAAFHLDADEFWRDRLPIFSLAVPGVVAAVVFTAGVLVPLLRWAGVSPAVGWGPGLVFATLIAATDPIAVVALVRTMGAPRRLGLLIESESLLNDGTAAVFFTIAVAYVLGQQSSTASLAVDFVYMTGAGVIVGGAIGMITSYIIARLDDPMLEITLTTIAAYGSFMAGERVQASGVIATVTAGLFCGTREARRALSASARVAVETFWEYVAFALNSLVFLLIGFQVRIPALLAAWRSIIIAYVVVSVGRALVAFAIAGIMPKANRLPPRWTAVLAWSGLRGGLSMVLALSLPATIPQRDTIVTITFGVVILSIVLQGLTVSPLLRWLGIARVAPVRATYERARGELLAARVALEELEHMATLQLMPDGVRETLTREYNNRVVNAETILGGLQSEGGPPPTDELHRARRHLLLVEKDHILDAFRLGAMTEAVRDALIADVDSRWVRSELGADEVRPE